jgi:hypothetical protein
MSIVLRGSSDPKMLVGTVREVVRQLDPDVPMYEIQAMTEELERFLLLAGAADLLPAVRCVRHDRDPAGHGGRVRHGVLCG